MRRTIELKKKRKDDLAFWQRAEDIVDASLNFCRGIQMATVS